MKKKILCIGLGVMLAVSALGFAACDGDDIAELQQQFTAMQTTVERRGTEISELKKDKEELQKQIDELEKNNDQLQKQNDELNERVDELAELQKQMEALNKRIDNLKDRIEDLEGTEMYGAFYELEEAYEKGIITQENLQQIADYPRDSIHLHALEKKIERKILHDYNLLDFPKSEELSVWFYGSYNGSYAIRIFNPQYDSPIQWGYSIKIAGITFYMERPYIQVWKPLEQ